VPDRVIEVHKDPHGEAWRHVSHHGLTETVVVQAFPEVAIRVADLFADGCAELPPLDKAPATTH
jgi:hypothetical protein